MPPKPKYTREQVEQAAFALVCEQGEEALTARELGRRLGISVTPLFTLFRDMEEVRQAVYARAQRCFEEYMAVAEHNVPAYKKRGMQRVRFAQEQPQLFRLLYMQRTGAGADYDRVMQQVGFNKDEDIAIIVRDYHATPQQAEHLFMQLWIYTYGLCVLCAAQVCSFSEAEIARRLGEIFRGMIHVLAADEAAVAAVQPVAADSDTAAQMTRQHPHLQPPSD